MKYFCERTSLINVIICCVVCVSLLFKNLSFLIISVSSMRMSFMLYVINLWFLFIFKPVRSMAKFVELKTL